MPYCLQQNSNLRSPRVTSKTTLPTPIPPGNCFCVNPSEIQRLSAMSINAKYGTVHCRPTPLISNNNPTQRPGNHRRPHYWSHCQHEQVLDWRAGRLERHLEWWHRRSKNLEPHFDRSGTHAGLHQRFNRDTAHHHLAGAS